MNQVVAAVHVLAFQRRQQLRQPSLSILEHGEVPYQLSAAYSTPPSNTAQYLTFLAATNAVPNTRINLNLRVGL